MLDRMKHRLHEILTNHVPLYMPKNAAEKIASILKAAEAREGYLKADRAEIGPPARKSEPTPR